jgi:hypothetical protein
MSSHLVRTYHFCCDRQGCDAHGNGKEIPPDWRFIQLSKPLVAGSGDQTKNDTAALLLCPPCVEFFKGQFHVRPKPPKEKP